nr:cytochrome c oxidase subunit 2 [Antarctophthirus lobodontis]
MARWGQMTSQDSMSPSMGLISSTYDWVMVLVLFVISVVFSTMMSSLKAKSWNLLFTKSETVEISWSIIPMLMLALTANPSLCTLYSIDSCLNPLVTLKAIGHQWYWSYEYPNTTSSSLDSYMLPNSSQPFRLLDVDQSLVLPYNVDIRLLTTSSDVIHSWTVPSLGVKMDAVPGRLNQTYFLSLQMGVVFGQCSEICGVMHSMMPVKVEFVPLSSFVKWISSQE